MNDIYKKLATQAADNCKLGNAWEWERKYALLVIKEVLDVVKSNLDYSSTVVDAVDQHFGVYNND